MGVKAECLLIVLTVVEYFRHLAQVKEDRIRLRVSVLICLKRINDKRISDVEKAIKRRKLNDGGSSSSSSSSGGGEVMINGSSSMNDINSSSNQQQEGQELNGVLAESKITAFEMWMEIAMFL